MKESGNFGAGDPFCLVMVAGTEFAGLVREFQGMVYSIAYNSLENRAAAEDIAQDVFLALHENLGRLESRDHARHWLAAVTSRRCIDEIRKRKLRAGPALHLMPEPRAAHTEEDPLLERRLRRKVASLPPAARMMIILRYQEDLGLPEIAEAMGLTVEKVKSRLHRSVELLRKRMLREDQRDAQPVREPIREMLR